MLRKNKYLENRFQQLLPDDLSDEAIYAIYTFLETLLTEVESVAFTHLRNYFDHEKVQRNNQPTENRDTDWDKDGPPF